MSQPTEGTYLVINANSLKALDVRGGSDASGTNVQQYTPNGSDAQIWTLTATDDGWRVSNSLTGRTLDVNGGTMADGTNVQQWNDNATAAQRWEIGTDGGTVTYDGETYDTYHFRSAKDDSYYMAVSNSSTAQSANVVIWSATGTAAQRWALVPVPALTEGGTYEIVPAVSESLRLDVNGGSSANGANVQVYSANGRTSQLFEASVDTGTGLLTLANAGSGKMVAVSGSGTSSGTNVIQWEATGSAGQSWMAVQDGTMVLNGDVVPTWALLAQVGSQLVMDVCGGGTALKTNVRVWTQNHSAAQRFHLLKSELLASDIPAPTQLTPTLAHGTGTVTVTPSFECDETAYQVRMRRTAHNADGSTTQGAWESPGGMTGRDGWGDAWSPAFEVEQGGVVSLPVALSEALDASVPRVDWEVEVRAFRASYGPAGVRAHGPSCVTTVTLALDPTVTTDEVTLDLDGDPALVVPLDSDVALDGNRASVRLLDSSSSPIMGGAVTQVVPRSGSVRVPVASLWSLPADGATVKVEYEFETPDGGCASGTLATTADIGSTAPSATFSDGTNLTDVVTASASARVWLAVPRGDGTELVEMPGDGTGRFVVCPPLNVAYTVLVATSSGVSSTSRPAKASPSCWWGWGDLFEHSASMRAQRGGGSPKQSMSHAPDTSVNLTSGRRWPIASAGRGGTLDLSVTGYVLGGDTHGPEAFEALAVALGRGMLPVYRDVRGGWHRVAVTGVSLDYDFVEGNSLTVTQQAVSP